VPTSALAAETALRQERSGQDEQAGRGVEVTRFACAERDLVRGQDLVTARRGKSQSRARRLRERPIGKTCRSSSPSLHLVTVLGRYALRSPT
jgi:hypothetical protein